MPNLRLVGRLRTLSFESQNDEGCDSPLSYTYGTMEQNRRKISVPDISPILLPTSFKKNSHEESSEVLDKPSFFNATLVSALFLCAGVAEVALNRWLLWKKDFHFPLITSAWADMFAIAMLFSAQRIGVWTYTSGSGKDWISRVVMLGILSCMNHALDMYGLMFLPPTIVKTIRTSKPLIAAFILYLARGVEQSCSKILCLLLAAGGAALMTLKSDVGFNLIGTSCVLVATSVSAVHFVLAAIVMSENGLTPMTLMALVTSISLLVILPPAVWYEGSDALAHLMYDDRAHVAIACLLLSGSLKFVHSILAWTLIRQSDPIYCTLLMCIKLPVVVGVTVPLFHDVLGPYGWIGVALACFGFVSYQYLDWMEYRAVTEELRRKGTPCTDRANSRSSSIESLLLG